MVERPSIGQAGHDSAGVVQAVHASRETPSTFRVYRKEWLFDSRHPSQESALEHFNTVFRGRLADGDWEVRPDDNGRDHVLWIRTWNVAGEWKWQPQAEVHKAQLVGEGYEALVVVRNSRAEHLLTLHGVVKMAR